MPSFFKDQKSKKNRQQNTENQPDNNSVKNIYRSLSANLDTIKQKTGNSSDVVIRQLKIGENFDIKIAIVYVEGIVDNQSIQEFLLESIMKDEHKETVNQQNAFDLISEDMITIGKVLSIDTWNGLFLSLLSGDTLILVDGTEQALSVDSKGGERRAITESNTQMVVRGPKDAFTESIGTNIAMFRRIF